MKSFKQHNDYQPGTWKGLKLQSGGMSASFSCPTCGKTGVLTDHTILKDGTVNPSVVCPYECGFHEYVKLEGWVG